MSDLREERDERQLRISEAIWDHAVEAFTENIPSGARALMAIEDVHAAVHSLIERIDDAGLTVTDRATLPAYAYQKDATA